MKCPECDSTESDIVDSRATPDSVRRRRRCTVCGERWTTYEMEASAYRAAMRLRRLNRAKVQAIGRKRRGGVDVPPELREEYERLQRKQGLRAREAAVALGIIKEE